ncbi:hypothetical protein GCM10027174_01960 [Salinifilum aidingensis]
MPVERTACTKHPSKRVSRAATARYACSVPTSTARSCHRRSGLHQRESDIAVLRPRGPRGRFRPGEGLRARRGED